VIEDLSTGGIRLECANTERASTREDASLCGADPLTPDLDHLPTTDRVIECPAADPVASFENDNRVPRSHQVAGGRQPGKPGANDRDIHHAGRLRGSRGRSVSERARRRSGSTDDRLPAGDVAHRPATTQ